jgi:hypothetical protein
MHQQRHTNDKANVVSERMKSASASSRSARCTAAYSCSPSLVARVILVVIAADDDVGIACALFLTTGSDNSCDKKQNKTNKTKNNTSRGVPIATIAVRLLFGTTQLALLICAPKNQRKKTSKNAKSWISQRYLAVFA